MSNELHKTLEWFKQAVPEPTPEIACVQIGCHLEEVSEMAEALGDFDLHHEVSMVADEYKKVVDFIPSEIVDRLALADSLADQIVTAIGVAYMYGIDIEGALSEVNRSNFSKFENGKPVFNENGKISKGKEYSEPNLEHYI